MAPKWAVNAVERLCLSLFGSEWITAFRRELREMDRRLPLVRVSRSGGWVQKGPFRPICLWGTRPGMRDCARPPGPLALLRRANGEVARVDVFHIVSFCSVPL